eukprot:1957117-Heterocapsa_arctica.AAC.1
MLQPRRSSAQTHKSKKHGKFAPVSPVARALAERLRRNRQQRCQQLCERLICQPGMGSSASHVHAHGDQPSDCSASRSAMHGTAARWRPPKRTPRRTPSLSRMW